jgi:hypothetical protein
MRALEKAILNRPTTPEGHFVKGSVVKSQYQYETHRNLEILKHNGKKKTIIHASNFPKVELDLDFLPAAAESYHISPNPEDYILVSLPIVSAGIPNRNLQCFPLEEITHFDPLYGSMVYETFKRKCTFTDHDNQDPTKAKGIHVDASMQYIPKYDLWKIVVLTMWDRTKDEQLVKDILNKKRNAYSMGATVNNFICSVCGKIDNLDAHSCEHMRPPGGIWGEKKRLAAQLCTGVCYFETSNLGNEPADPTAYSEDIYI